MFLDMWTGDVSVQLLPSRWVKTRTFESKRFGFTSQAERRILHPWWRHGRAAVPVGLVQWGTRISLRCSLSGFRFYVQAQRSQQDAHRWTHSPATNRSTADVTFPCWWLMSRTWSDTCRTPASVSWDKTLWRWRPAASSWEVILKNACPRSHIRR